ncbi:MAG: radical SAM protein [candidate division WOR-3 bacterium]|nr:radical SAM protein [candidate division WOR-3 bacterium]MCX7757403.1 radical SAM protein [candidate division WOR-3 bacterium]MDW7987881.1 radical SAM protein [candidate division WOR-3 bacterium]
MLDLKNFPQKPIFIDWAITTSCNLSCAHCRYLTPKSNKKKKSSELNSQQAQILASEISQVTPQWVLIEGGEPFLRKDIFEIIRAMKSNNSELIVFIITSGMEFSTKLALDIADLKAKVIVSVDSVNPDTYQRIRRGADFVEMINSILIAKENKILDSINVTLQEANATPLEIKSLGRFAYLMGIPKINFLGLKPGFLGFKSTKLQKHLPKLFGEIVNIQTKYNLQVYVDEPFFKSWCAKNQIFISAKSQNGPIVVEERAGCIFGEYLFIEPNGQLKPCSFSPLTIDEIGWDTILKIQNKKNRNGKCASCKYQLICGGCRVRSYVLTGDWYASDPYCPI